MIPREDKRDEVFMSTTKIVVVSIHAFGPKKAALESQQLDGRIPVFPVRKS
jgi:hypothetical protein